MAFLQAQIQTHLHKITKIGDNLEIFSFQFISWSLFWFIAHTVIVWHGLYRGGNFEDVTIKSETLKTAQTLFASHYRDCWFPMRSNATREVSHSRDYIPM